MLVTNRLRTLEARETDAKLTWDEHKYFTITGEIMGKKITRKHFGGKREAIFSSIYWNPLEAKCL